MNRNFFFPLLLLVFIQVAAGSTARAESEAEFEKWALRVPKLRLPQYVDFLNERLEEVYQHELSKLTPRGQELLSASQAAWRAYLDADLKAGQGDESIYGGSGGYSRLAQRRIWQTKLRIFQLETPFDQGWSSPPYIGKEAITRNGSGQKTAK